MDWLLHAQGVLTAQPAPATNTDLSIWPPPGAQPIDLSGAYPQLAAHGYQYGPTFQGLHSLWRRGQEIYAEVNAPTDTTTTATTMGIHPAVLDAALQAAALITLPDTDTTATELPFSWRGVTLHATGATRVRARISTDTENTLNIELTDTTGLPVLTVQSLTTRRINTTQLHAALTAAANTDQGLLQLAWTPLTPTTPTTQPHLTSWPHPHPHRHRPTHPHRHHRPGGGVGIHHPPPTPHLLVTHPPPPHLLVGWWVRCTALLIRGWRCCSPGWAWSGPRLWWC